MRQTDVYFAPHFKRNVCHLVYHSPPPLAPLSFNFLIIDLLVEPVMGLIYHASSWFIYVIHFSSSHFFLRPVAALPPDPTGWGCSFQKLITVPERKYRFKRCLTDKYAQFFISCFIRFGTRWSKRNFLTEWRWGRCFFIHSINLVLQGSKKVSIELLYSLETILLYNIEHTMNWNVNK